MTTAVGPCAAGAAQGRAQLPNPLFDTAMGVLAAKGTATRADCCLQGVLTSQELPLPAIFFRVEVLKILK